MEPFAAAVVVAVEEAAAEPDCRPSCFWWLPSIVFGGRCCCGPRKCCCCCCCCRYRHAMGLLKAGPASRRPIGFRRPSPEGGVAAGEEEESPAKTSFSLGDCVGRPSETKRQSVGSCIVVTCCVCKRKKRNPLHRQSHHPWKEQERIEQSINTGHVYCSKRCVCLFRKCCKKRY